MNLNLRQAIVQRLHDKSTGELQEVIDDSIGNDERTLPGLGVIFEIIWKHSDPKTHQSMVTTLHEHLAQQE